MQIYDLYADSETRVVNLLEIRAGIYIRRSYLFCVSPSFFIFVSLTGRKDYGAFARPCGYIHYKCATSFKTIYRLYIAMPGCHAAADIYAS